MKTLSAQFIASLVQVGIIAVLLRLLPRLAPAASRLPATSGISEAELQDRFGRTNWLIGGITALLGIFIAFALHWALVSDQFYFIHGDKTAIYLFLPSKAVFWFLPGFAALSCCYEVMLLLWTLLAGAETVSMYEYWSNQKTGVDGRKLLRVLTLIISLPIAVATVLALPMHSSFGEDEILLWHYATLHPQTYRYSDIRNISVADGYSLRNGSFQRDPQVILTFADGRRWSSRDSRDIARQMDESFVAFLSAKTHLPIGRFQRREEIPKPETAP